MTRCRYVDYDPSELVGFLPGVRAGPLPPSTRRCRRPAKAGLREPPRSGANGHDRRARRNWHLGPRHVITLAPSAISLLGVRIWTGKVDDLFLRWPRRDGKMCRVDVAR